VEETKTTENTTEEIKSTIEEPMKTTEIDEDDFDNTDEHYLSEAPNILQTRLLMENTLRKVPSDGTFR
jgi:hypothetical protein